MLSQCRVNIVSNEEKVMMTLMNIIFNQTIVLTSRSHISQMSHVLHKSNPDELISSAHKFPTHDHLLYSTTKHGPCAGCFQEKERFYECRECDILFHKECIESATEINAQQNLGEVRAVEDKPNDESINVEGNAQFTDEHQLVLNKDGKVDDDINTTNDACKFKQILENYRFVVFGYTDLLVLD